MYSFRVYIFENCLEIHDRVRNYTILLYRLKIDERQATHLFLEILSYLFLEIMSYLYLGIMSYLYLGIMSYLFLGIMSYLFLEIMSLFASSRV